MGDALEVEFEEEDYDNYDTLNGFLISKLDRIPKEGEQPEVEYGGFHFKVLSVENKMVLAVMVLPCTQGGPDGVRAEMKETQPRESAEA